MNHIIDNHWTTGREDIPSISELERKRFDLSAKVGFLEYVQGMIVEHKLDAAFAKATMRSLNRALLDLTEAEEAFSRHPDSRREMNYFGYASELARNLK